MENKTWIIILSISLALSLLVNITSFYTISYIDSEWQEDYYKNDLEWCQIANNDNSVINGFIDQLIYYDEDYREIPYMKDLDCLVNYLK